MESGIPASKIALAGFSQGGSISMVAGLTAPSEIGGIVTLSSYLPFADILENYIRNKNHNNKTTPLLMAHGASDTLLTLEKAQGCAVLLSNMGYQVDLKTYK